MRQYEEYLICQKRGHQSDGRIEGHESATWYYCKWCGTKFWTTTTPEFHEENAPAQPLNESNGGQNK